MDMPISNVATLLRKAGWSESDIGQYEEAWAQPGWITGACNYYRAAEVGPATQDGRPANGNYVPHLTDLTVTVPTLVIWGEQDRFLLPGNLDGLDQYVSDLTITRVPNGSHWVVHEHLDLVNRAIRVFLADGSA